MGVEENRSLGTFLHTLVEGSRAQRIACLNTLSVKQLKLLRELAFNILFNTGISISECDRKYIRRHTLVVKQLASKRTTGAEKRRLACHYHYLIKKLAAIALVYFDKP
jgi:hypothetical protein